MDNSGSIPRLREVQGTYDKEGVLMNTCKVCGKVYEDHDFLCPDDVCVDCHGGLDEFIQCHMRHFFLAETQCFNLTFKTGEYEKNIEAVTIDSMGKIRNIVDFVRKYDRKVNDQEELET